MKNIQEIGACSSAFGIWTGSALKNLNVEKAGFSPEEFLQYAQELDLGGVELPPLRFFNSPEKDIPELLGKANAAGMFLFYDCDLALFEDQIKWLAPYVAATTTRTVRIKTSDILGCERYKMNKVWQEHVEELASRLCDLKSVVHDHGIKLAIENHQDLDSDDLKFILDKINSDSFGVNWDIGNSLATLETPMGFVQKFDTKVFNAHIKDYCILKHENGYGLARCVIGDGVIDFAQLFSHLEKTSPECFFSIELGAHPVRWIQFKEPAFFSHFKNRTLKGCEKFISSFLNGDLRSENASPIFEMLKRGELTTFQAVEMEKKQFNDSVQFIKKIK